MTRSKAGWPGTTDIVMALSLATLLAGCSYTPAHVRTEPLIEIDGHSAWHSRRHEQDDQGENDNAQ
ncbi:hypothetical protein BOX17_00655 [Halomonas aestuarii]|uniref:Uncharacterized protein n=1 Tax=Halomonas aestuarii TaxID=1897729 RepID=A0A1J0VC56_9GAMM|nr:hypothetical protein [Halomonas aestuarii]APE29596.1 hypothetical protein BOX17_00655 [Halomonas aestuarii]